MRTPGGGGCLDLRWLHAYVLLSRLPIIGSAGRWCADGQLGASACWEPAWGHQPKLTHSAGAWTALADLIQSPNGVLGVWIACLTWQSAMPKILAFLHVVSQLINLPKLWNTVGYNAKTQHLLGESLDPALC